MENMLSSREMVDLGILGHVSNASIFELIQSTVSHMVCLGKAHPKKRGASGEEPKSQESQ